MERSESKDLLTPKWTSFNKLRFVVAWKKENQTSPSKHLPRHQVSARGFCTWPPKHEPPRQVQTKQTIAEEEKTRSERKKEKSHIIFCFSFRYFFFLEKLNRDRTRRPRSVYLGNFSISSGPGGAKREWGKMGKSAVGGGGPAVFAYLSRVPPPNSARTVDFSCPDMPADLLTISIIGFVILPPPPSRCTASPLPSHPQLSLFRTRSETETNRKQLESERGSVS